MRLLLNFAAGIVALTIACRLLLPCRVRAMGINRAAFWLVLVAGAEPCIVKLARR
jgi:hypothetical protein